jgi:hypothetical protein
LDFGWVIQPINPATGFFYHPIKKGKAEKSIPAFPLFYHSDIEVDILSYFPYIAISLAGLISALKIF